MMSNIQRKKFALKVRRDDPQPGIFVRSFRSFTSWYNEEDRTTMLAAIERINQSIASAYNLPADLYPTTVMKGGSKVLANDAEMATIVKPALQALLGEKAVLTEVPKVMGSEDFHHLVIENERHRYLSMYVGTAKPEHVQKAQAQGKLVVDTPDAERFLQCLPGRFLCFAPISSVSRQKSSNIRAIY